MVSKMHLGHAFHPDEASVRIFRTSGPGVLRLDDEIAITEAVYDGVVRRRYAFADRWFKINVTTNLAGDLVETGSLGHRHPCHRVERARSARTGLVILSVVAHEAASAESARGA
jgi:hypothetical protein